MTARMNHPTVKANALCEPKSCLFSKAKSGSWVAMKRKLVQRLWLLWIVWGMAILPGWGAVFNVTNINNSGAGSLRDAVTQANNAAGADEIRFNTAGVFATPQAIVLNTPLSFSGLLTITGPPAVANRVALRANAGGTRLFTPTGSSVTLTLTDLLIEDAHAVGANAGGGVLQAGAGTVVTFNADRCFFDDCIADGLGGLLRLTAAIVNFNDCTFTDNQALGGSLFYIETGVVTIRGGVAARNASTGAGTNAGDLIGMEAGFLTMDGFELRETTAANLLPLAIEVGRYSGNASTRGIVSVSMIDCNVHDNEGAVLESHGGPITVTRCVFDHNGAVIKGGLFEDACVISGCTFTNNGSLAHNSGDITVEDTVAENNTGSFSAQEDLTLRRVDLRFNGAMPGSMSGLLAEDCEFHQNTGVLGRGLGTIRDVTLRRCGVSGTTGLNDAYEITGLVANGAQSWMTALNVLLESCTLNGNTGLAQALTSAKLLNCTFTNNSGQAVMIVGGTDDTTADFTLQNSVFSGNTNTNAGNVIFQSTDPPSVVSRK